jgi:peptidase C13-like protein
VWSVLKVAARAAAWRPTRELTLVGLPALLGWAAVLAVVRIAIQFVAAIPTPIFSPYGLNAVVAWLAVELAVAAFFVRPIGRATALSSMFILSIIGDVATAAISLGAAWLTAHTALDPFWTKTVMDGAIFLVATVWWLGAMGCVLRSLQAEPPLRLMARAVALWAALLAADALVPHAPVFFTPAFDLRKANLWESLYSRHLAARGGGEQNPDGILAQIEQAQPKLLQDEVARLAPRHNGATGIYAIGLAGWADQDVFVKELDGALASIASELPIKDRIIRLINHRDTLASVPLASPQNFAAAVHAIGTAMDKEKDVLILLMTSHGDRAGVGLQLPNSPVIELTPQQVASTLDGEGIKNRVVIVSACYAGIFVPPLANENTIVITAADGKSTSFGCAPERDWTYFGDALFRQSLQPGTDFEHAFEHARTLIQGWELMDHAQPSNPQAHFGSALVAKLEPFFAASQNAER